METITAFDDEISSLNTWEKMIDWINFKDPTYRTLYLFWTENELFRTYVYRPKNNVIRLPESECDYEIEDKDRIDYEYKDGSIKHDELDDYNNVEVVNGFAHVCVEEVLRIFNKKFRNERGVCQSNAELIKIYLIHLWYLHSHEPETYSGSTIYSGWDGKKEVNLYTTDEKGARVLNPSHPHRLLTLLKEKDSNGKTLLAADGLLKYCVFRDLYNSLDGIRDKFFIAAKYFHNFIVNRATIQPGRVQNGNVDNELIDLFCQNGEYRDHVFKNDPRTALYILGKLVNYEKFSPKLLCDEFVSQVLDACKKNSRNSMLYCGKFLVVLTDYKPSVLPILKGYLLADCKERGIKVRERI